MYKVGASVAKTTSAGNRAAGTVPLARLEAFMFDRSLPSTVPVRATVVLESPNVRVFELLGNIGIYFNFTGHRAVVGTPALSTNGFSANAI